MAAKKNRQREEIREEPPPAAVAIAEPIQEIATPAEILGREAPAPWSDEPRQHDFFVVRDITADAPVNYEQLCNAARSVGLRLAAWQLMGYGRILFQFERLPTYDFGKLPLSDADIRMALSR